MNYTKLLNLWRLICSLGRCFHKNLKKRGVFSTNMCAHKKIQLGRELPFVNSSLRPIGACIHQLKNQPHCWLLYNSVSSIMSQLFMLFNNRFVLARRFCNLLDNIHTKLRVGFSIIVSPRLMSQLIMVFNNMFILARKFCNLLDNIHNKLRVGFHPNFSNTMFKTPF